VAAAEAGRSRSEQVIDSTASTLQRIVCAHCGAVYGAGYELACHRDHTGSKIRRLCLQTLIEGLQTAAQQTNAIDAINRDDEE
jgi:hypothetical protein